MSDLESLWDLVAGQRSSLQSPLDDLLAVLDATPELRAAANLEAISQLREALRATPATVECDAGVVISAQSALLLGRLLLARFR